VVSEKGQVTIPKQLRDRLGIQPGEVLEFEEDGGRLIADRVGGGVAPPPLTPPDMRVRIRRFVRPLG